MRLSESPELVSTSKEGIGPPPTSPMHVRNVAFTLLSIAIVILLLQCMQPVLLPLIFAHCCSTPSIRPSIAYRGYTCPALSAPR
jgi:hypothetical protein